jgi:hypothetical protein
MLGPLLTWTLRLTSVAVGVGVYQFNTNDIGADFLAPLLTAPSGQLIPFLVLDPGLTEFIRRVWTA